MREKWQILKVHGLMESPLQLWALTLRQSRYITFHISTSNINQVGSDATLLWEVMVRGGGEYVYYVAWCSVYPRKINVREERKVYIRKHCKLQLGVTLIIVFSNVSSSSVRKFSIASWTLWDGHGKHREETGGKVEAYGWFKFRNQVGLATTRKAE